eukprot:6490998-Amphidinium_carterae.2
MVRAILLASGLHLGGLKEVERWKAKCDLNKVLTDDFDGRTLTGLLACIDKLERADTHRMEVAILRNLSKVVQACRNLARANIKQMPQSDLEALLSCIAEAGAELPIDIQQKLLHRRAEQLLHDKQFTELLQTMNPFVSLQPFSSIAPTMSGIKGAQENRIETYNALVFQKLLVDGIIAGEEGSHNVKTLAEVGLTSLDVCIVDLDEKQCFELGEQESIWKACLALLTDSIETGYEDPCQS